MTRIKTLADLTKLKEDLRKENDLINNPENTESLIQIRQIVFGGINYL